MKHLRASRGAAVLRGVLFVGRGAAVLRGVLFVGRGAAVLRGVFASRGRVHGGGPRRVATLFSAASFVMLALTAFPASAFTSIDRAVVRFSARETGGVDSPRFIFERELAFEARLESLAEGGVREGEPPFRPRHVQAALERHITESVLETQGLDPPPGEAAIAARVEQTRISLAERVGGRAVLVAAAAAEGISDGEVLRMLRREALASLYLDRAVLPMLAPSVAELRSVHRTERTPYSGRPFEEIQESLTRWYVANRLAASLSSYYDGLRARLSITILR